MALNTIAIMMPGDMGHGCAIAFREAGFRVVTSLAGRSERTRGLAKKAGIEDLADLEEVLGAAELVLSILPPSSALDQAKQIAAAMAETGRKPVYADCNAVSPATSQQIGEEITGVGAPYVDAGIIGRNPVAEQGQTRFYVSGADLSLISELDGKGVQVRPIGDEPGRASAIKMVYAAVTKGTWTLQAAALTVAHSMGLTEAYFRELSESRAQEFEVMNRMVPHLPLDAGRWIGEMHEIAATFEAAGLPPDFHKGAAAMFSLMDRTPIAEETRETVDTSRTLEQALEMYVAALDGK